MVFNGLFNEMSPAQSAAILSCFVCDEKSNEMPKLTQELSGPLRQMQDMAKQIAKVSKEAKIEIDEEQYISKFKPFMMDVVFEVFKIIPFKHCLTNSKNIKALTLSSSWCYSNIFLFNLQWCKGASFCDLCKITDLFEGKHDQYFIKVFYYVCQNVFYL